MRGCRLVARMLLIGSFAGTCYRQSLGASHVCLCFLRPGRGAAASAQRCGSLPTELYLQGSARLDSGNSTDALAGPHRHLAGTLNSIHLCLCHLKLQAIRCLQDAPRDVPGRQLASLASTSEVLAALQKAHTAKRTILSNGPPVRVDTLQLPNQSAAPTSAEYRWSTLACRETAFSSCGHWLAVVLEGEQWWWSSPDKPEDHGPPWQLAMFEVVLYSAADDFQQQARFPTGRGAPVLQWAASEPRLCIAHLPRAPRQNPRTQGPPSTPPRATPGSSQAQTPQIRPQLPAALVVEAPMGAVLHSLGPEASAQVHAMAKWGSQRILWSPACTHLLVCGAEEPSHAEMTYAGCLCLVDVAGNRVLASSAACYGPLEWNDAQAVHVAWHPQGILLSSDVQLADAAAFRDAGFAVGVLPAHFFLDFYGSVVGAGHLVARHTTSYAYHPEDTVRTWLSCHIRGQDLIFAVGEPLGASALQAWRLHGSASPQLRKYVSPEAGAASAPSDPPQPSWPSQSPGSWSISPSGRFVLGKGPGGLAILDVDTHKKYWDLGTSDPSWSGLTRLQRGRAKHGTILGLQAVLDMGKAAKQLKTSFKIEGWLPSGLGVLCSTAATGPKEVLPPTLQCYWFA